MKIEAGTTFGSYEIVHPVGAGGMGSVYKARDLRLGRELAIKFLHDDLSESRLQLHRFEREARAASALNHPSIITIYEIGEHQGHPYIAMEYVEGRRLRDVLVEGPLPLDRGLEIAVAMADALGTAHGRGIVHRDLKPENVMVTPEGRVKILDFGLAKPLDPSATAPDSKAETLPGVVVGTAGYMSPEQAKGASADFRSDQFALGTMLYEIFSGHSPFRRESSMETISAILRDAQRPLTAVNPQIPVELADIVDRCLQKEPANRYASTTDLAHDLRQVHRRYTSATHSLPSFRPASAGLGRRGVLIVATAGVLLALAALLAFLPSRAPKPAPTANEPARAAGSKTLVILPFLESNGTLRDEGLSMIVSAQLGSVGGLQVIPPWGIPGDRDRTDIRGLARYLDASYAMTTTVSRVGDQLRVAFSLLDPATGKQIAGNTIQGEAANPFNVAERLANEIAAALDVRIDHPSLTGDLLSPEGQDSFLAAAGALLRYDDPAMVDQAVALLEPLAKANAESALVHAALGRAYQSKYQLSKDPKWIDLAVSASTRASRLSPKRPEVHVTLSKLFVMTGKPDQAVLEARKALALHPNDSDALLALAAAYQKKDDPEAAEATYKRAIALKPRHWAAYNGLGTHYYFQGRYPEAAQMFSKVVELTPDNSRGVTNLAGALMQMGRYESAVEVFRRATEARPQDPVAYTNLGNGYYFTSRLEEARGAFLKAVALAPNNARHRLNLADCLHVLGADAEERAAYREGIRLALEALRVDPRDQGTHRQLILAYSRTGDYKRAEAHLKKALELDPKDDEAMWYAALMSFERGDRAAGASWLRKAVAAGSDPERIARDPAIRPFRPYPEVSQIIADSAQTRGPK